jgi:3-oxoacyl-[acyl-carrier protein] reductase
VIVHGRAPQCTAAVVEAVEEAGGDVTFVLGDLAVEEGADAVYAAASIGVPVGILVNSTGVFDTSRSWTDLAASDWADIYSVNVLSSVRMIQRFVPGTRERGWVGHPDQQRHRRAAGRVVAPLRGDQRCP